MTKGREASATVDIKIRMKEPLRAQIEIAAKSLGTSMNAEMVDRLEQSFPELTYPPEIAALAELIARAMTETGNAIEGLNHIAGHGRKSWLDDPYAYDQAIMAAVRVLTLSKPLGEPEPHGLFTSAGVPNPEQIGQLMADGILEVLRGRHTEPGSTPMQWMPRVRAKLGSIATRLSEQDTPDDYLMPKRTVAGKPMEPGDKE
ncbi:MAG TPA: Arc family DNA-binding protein [Stellaceae bacterium]|jgi:hypothetical protein|nr:Arc family DNA-binding protein [Stellaceae bacterium]